MQRVPEEEVSFGESWVAGIAVDRWDNTNPGWPIKASGVSERRR